MAINISMLISIITQIMNKDLEDRVKIIVKKYNKKD